MSDLVDFLTQRLAEDEAVARAALKPAEMFPYGDERLTPYTPEQVPDAVRGYLGGPWGEHFARHDPARALREVTAKRAILAECSHVTGQKRVPTSVPGRYDVVDVRAVNVGGHDSAADAETILRALALPFSDHPDFQEQWR